MKLSLAAALAATTALVSSPVLAQTTAPAPDATAVSAAPSAATPAATAQPAATAPDQTRSAPPVTAPKVADPPAGKGQVVFFRKRAFQGSAIWFRVRENGTDLGKLTPGRYFVQVEDPGVHTFTAATEATDTIRLDVEPGETYYVEGTITMGLLVGRASMRPATAAEFVTVSDKLKLADAPAPAAPSPAPSSTTPAGSPGTPAS